MAFRPRGSAGRQFIPQDQNPNGPKGSFSKSVKYSGIPNPLRPMATPADNGPSAASHMRPEKYDVVSGPAPMKTTNAFHGQGAAATPQSGLNLGFNK